MQKNPDLSILGNKNLKFYKEKKIIKKFKEFSFFIFIITRKKRKKLDFF